MHKEILTKEQVELLPLIKTFKKDFGLVGGTAIALQIGHRQSIDFDLFSFNKFDNAKIRNKIVRGKFKVGKVYRDETGQFTFIMNNVQFTFFQYPFKITFSKNFINALKMPDILTLAAMKAYALGRRLKWKDYVDLYFIMDGFYPINRIEKRAEKIFKKEFNAKLFRMQLSYFDDINYQEKVTYLPGFSVDEKLVKKKLVEYSLEK